MTHCNPQSMDFKEFEEERKGRPAIPAKESFLEVRCCITDVAKNELIRQFCKNKGAGYKALCCAGTSLGNLRAGGEDKSDAKTDK